MNDIINILDGGFTASTNAVSRFGMTRDLTNIGTKDEFRGYILQREGTGELNVGTLSKLEGTEFFQNLK